MNSSQVMTMRGGAAAFVTVIVFLLVTQLTPHFLTAHAETSPTADAIVQEKLSSFLSDVIGLDLPQYNITNEGYGVSYPSRFGGVVKEEHLSFTLDSNDYKITVGSVFDNGFPWIQIRALNGSLIYKTQPSKDALVEVRNIIQRYQVFAEKYGIDTVDTAAALNLLSSIPDMPQAGGSYNFNGMSNLTPANATSGDMKLVVTQTSVAFCYTSNGVDVNNRYFGINFGYGAFHFWDSWNLYHVGSFSAITQEEAQAIALGSAENLMATQPLGTDHGPELINVTWSSRVDAGMLMIPGQSHNNTDLPIPPPDDFYNGNVTRDPLGLYPLWQFIFYFNQSYGDICGVQVAVWGDTKEIAYCSTYGFLGSWPPSSTPIPESTNNSTQTSEPTDDSTSISHAETSDSSSQGTFHWLPVAAVSVAVVAVIALTAVVLTRKRKRGVASP
jgi:hypothetical protein